MNTPVLDEGRVWWVWLWATLLAGALVAAFSAVYVHYGAAYVDGLDEQLPALRQAAGERYERAGELDPAIAEYRAAIDLGITGYGEAQTLKALGRLLWVRGDYAEARDVLARAAAHPRQDLNVYMPYLSTLARLGDFDALAPVAEEYRTKAEAGQAPWHISEAQYWRGVAAQAQGDVAAALAAWQAGIAADPDGRAAYALGRHLFDTGDHAAARPLLEGYAAKARGRREFAPMPGGDTEIYAERAEARRMLRAMAPADSR